MKKTIIKLLLCIFFLAPAAGGQETLTLNKYLGLVESTNPDIRSADYSIQAAGQKAQELDMNYSPILSGAYNYTDDKSGASFGSTMATREMKATAWSVNASKKFFTGTTLTLGYTNSEAAFDLYSPISIMGNNLTNFTGYEVKPYAQVSQSLLRDFMAGITQTGIDKAKAQARSGQYMLLFKKQQLLLRARSVYWNLSLAREVVAFRQASLDRAKKLLDWNENKYKLDLVDKGDYLQTQAAYKLRQLNLQLAQEDLVKAVRDFNQMLGKQDNAVNSELEKISEEISSLDAIGALERSGKRADVLSAESTYKSAQFAEEETKYRALPELSLNGSYSSHGLALNYSDAWEQASNNRLPVYAVGLSFIVPLDYKTLNTVKAGYKNEFYSAKDTLDSTLLAEKNDWDQLQVSWKNVKSRLKLGEEIRVIQNKRVENEQDKFRRGRTTTFQLLSAENDLDDATLNVYRMVFEELMTHAQAELYNTREMK